MLKVNQERIVIGKRAVTELLKLAPERLDELLLVNNKLPEELEKLVKGLKLRVKNVRQEELSEAVSSTSHQGIAAVLKERHYVSISEVISKAEFAESSLLVMLDGVTDPHNLGAVMRAAECFGATGVIWSKNRAVGITPVVTKSAQGATELLDLIPVGNLADTLRKLKDAGFWCAASALSEDSQPLATFDIPNKVVLILGSEGKGISSLVMKLADFVLEVPMCGAIDSLNVSQAASVFLYEFRKKMTEKGW